MNYLFVSPAQPPYFYRGGRGNYSTYPDSYHRLAMWGRGFHGRA